MGGDCPLVGLACDERRERRPGAGSAKGIQSPFGQVGDARGEADAQDMRQRKHVVADATAIGVMGGDAEVCLMVEQAVDDVRRLAGAGDRRGVERRVAVGYVRVEQRRRLAAVWALNAPTASPRPAVGKCWPSELDTSAAPNRAASGWLCWALASMPSAGR